MTVWEGSTQEFRAAGWEDAVRRLLDRAFEGDFSEDDWSHSLGGRHFVVLEGSRPLAHAAVVPRDIVVNDRGHLQVGYLEGVGTEPARQRQGYGQAVVRPATDHLRSTYELGALSTSEPAFYERLGWQRWRGRTWVDAPEGRLRTADEDDGILVLLTDRTRELALDGDLVCDWRAGDVW